MGRKYPPLVIGGGATELQKYPPMPLFSSVAIFSLRARCPSIAKAVSSVIYKFSLSRGLALTSNAEKPMLFGRLPTKDWAFSSPNYLTMAATILTLEATRWLRAFAN